MKGLSWLRRKRNARGYGVHSPFAFELITKVIHSPYGYYAFEDIPVWMKYKGFDPNQITPFNHLSYRLVEQFKPAKILEINSGNGLNTFFIRKAYPYVQCTCVETDPSAISEAQFLHFEYRDLPRIVSKMPTYSDGPFDAIFIHASEGELPPINRLLEWGHEKTFWVIHPINESQGKLYWKEIVNEKSVTTTIALKETGLAFPWPSLTPSAYLV